MFYKPFTFTNQTVFQYSSDDLHSINAMNIGVFYTVRGFREDGVSGSTGIYLKNELSYGSYIKFNQGRNFTAIQYQPFIALDSGSLFGDKTTNAFEESGQVLSGFTLGANLYVEGLTGKVFASYPLTKTDTMSENNLLFGLQGSLSF